MATLNSATNLPTFQATNDSLVTRATSKLKLAGIVVVSTSQTAVVIAKLTDNAGTLVVLPQVKVKSGGFLFSAHFHPPIELTGLKAVVCSNAAITAQLV